MCRPDSICIDLAAAKFCEAHAISQLSDANHGRPQGGLRRHGRRSSQVVDEQEQAGQSQHAL